MTTATSIVHDPRDGLEPVEIDKAREQLIRWLLEKPKKSGLGVVSVLGPPGFGTTTFVKKVYDSEEVKQHFPIRIWFSISRYYDTTCLLRELIMAIYKHEDREWLFSELEYMGAKELKQILSVGCLNEKCMIVMDDMWYLGAWNEIKSALPRRGRGRGSRIIMTTCSEDIATSCQGNYGYVCKLKLLSSTEETTERDPELNDLDKILNDLSDHLKSCFLYLCLFPDNYVIKCSRLLRLWVAEGFCESERWLHISKEDVAKSYLDELIARSLIQEKDIDGSGRARTCCIHNHVHNHIKKARDQNSTDLFMNWSSNMEADIHDRVRRLSIFIKEDVEEYNLPNGKWFLAQIQSFLAHGESSLFNSSIVTIFLSGRIQFLKVLDLEGIHLDEFPGEALSSLLTLSYLGLNSERLSDPSSLGRLVNLETLVLKGSLFFKLPVEILGLKRLRNLLGNFLELPNGIGQLATLEKLCTVVGYDGIDEELGKLTQLRSLDILLKKPTNAHITSSVQKMEHLRSLRLRMSDPNKLSLELENLTYVPPFLTRITLIGGLTVGTFDEIVKRRKLTKLRLAFSGLRGDFFIGLQKLSDLHELVLEMDAIKVDVLHFRQGRFSKLRTLKLHGLTLLKRIKVDKGAMPLIRHICFWDCQNLENVPVEIKHLTTLNHVDWFGMPTRLENEARSFCWRDGHSLNVNQSFDKFSLAD